MGGFSQFSNGSSAFEVIATEATSANSSTDAQSIEPPINSGTEASSVAAITAKLSCGGVSFGGGGGGFGLVESSTLEAIASDSITKITLASSNDVGQSIQPQLVADSDTHADPVAATTPLSDTLGSSPLGSNSSQLTPDPSRSSGLSSDAVTPASLCAATTDVGSFAFGQPTPVASSSSSLSNNAGALAELAVGSTTSPASSFAAAVISTSPFTVGLSNKPAVDTATPAISFAPATPFGPPIQPAVTTATIPETTTSIGNGGATFGGVACFGGGGSHLFGTFGQPSTFGSTPSSGFSTTAGPSSQFRPPAGFLPSVSVFGDPPPSHTSGVHFQTLIGQPDRPTLLSISAMPVYDNISHEELRCIDYQVGDKGGWVQKSVDDAPTSGNSAFGSAPTQPPAWGNFQSTIFGSPTVPASAAFGVPDSGSSAFQSAFPYVRPRWGSRVVSYTPTVEQDQTPYYPQPRVEKQINVPKVDKFTSSFMPSPAEPQEKQNDKQTDGKKMKDLRKAVELELEVERRVSEKHRAFLTSMLEKLDSLSIGGTVPTANPFDRIFTTNPFDRRSESGRNFNIY